MKHSRNWFRSSRHVLAVLLGTVCILGGALAWLCWRLLEQDRQLESQRAQERLERAADLTAAAWASRLQSVEAWLPVAGGARADMPPSGLALLRKTAAGITVWPAGRLAYLPPAPPPAREVTEPFAAGEWLEFRQKDFAAAAGRFRALVNSKNDEIRAGALLRLGRSLRKMGSFADALDAYEELSGLKDVVIEGVPADLIGFDARSGVLEAMGRGGAARTDALAIDAGLRGGRWRLSSAAWEFYRAQAGRRAETPALTAAERQAAALSRAAGWADQLWPRPLEPAGRRVVSTAEGPALVSWSADETRLAAVLVAPGYFQEIWKGVQADPAVSAALLDADAKVVVGSVTSSPLRAVRSPAAKGMAAALVLTWRDPAAGLASAALRRRFLLAGFAMLALVLAGGSYLMARFVAREAEVSRMQAEFVAAVSHEFRTPLASIRQLSEMLSHDRIASDAERREAYQILVQASERLRKLVESLLDFGRMEAAAFRYRFDQLDARTLVQDVVSAFRLQAAQGHTVELAQPSELPVIRGDRDALGIAIWNLLDNAVKYSPGRPTVWVETRPEGPAIAISVRDEGPGIERSERNRIFEKFARGSAARGSNIKGTGIGLSMTRHIALAHGGEIRLASQPGRGSTFTLVLPVEAER